MTDDELRKNIRKEREALKLSAEEVAIKSGIGKQTIYDIESGKVQIKVGVLRKLKAVLPNLETGFEPTISTFQTIENPIGKSISEIGIGKSIPKNVQNLDLVIKQESKPNTNPETVQIPEYDVQLSAGMGNYPADHALAIGYRSFDIEWLKKKGLEPSNLSLVRVQGDSMEPMLKDKDVVMIDHNRTQPSDYYPFAIYHEDAVYIKLIQKKQNTLTLNSVNGFYPPIHIDLEKDNYKVIGAIVWHAHSWI